MSKKISPILCLVCVLLASACKPSSSYPHNGFEKHRSSIDAGDLEPYKAALAVDRATMGFPPLPTTGEVWIQTIDRTVWDYEYPPPPYDVYLQFYDDPDPTDYQRCVRSVALKKTDEGMKWVHESISFDGPKNHIVDDSPTHEQISILNETEQIGVIGTQVHGTRIEYSGPDRSLARRSDLYHNLTLAEIAPIIKSWGYQYKLKP